MSERSAAKRRKTTSPSREVIDVDEYYSKHCEDPDGQIFHCTQAEFRKTWLANRKSRLERSRSHGSFAESSQSAANRRKMQMEKLDHPLEEMSSKRSHPESNVHNPNKRQKANTSKEIIELLSEEEDIKFDSTLHDYEHFGSNVQNDTIRELKEEEEDHRDDIDDDDDDEDDDFWDPLGFGLNDPNAWAAITSGVQKEDGVLLNLIETLPTPLLPGYRRQNTSLWCPPHSSTPPGKHKFIWNKLQMVENLRWRPRSRPISMQPRKLITRQKDVDFKLYNLKKVTSFKQAPGTINAIEQSGDQTLIGSACVGGLADVSDETPSPYNRPGSLSVWSNDRHVVLDAHKRGGNQPKYYTINDIKFDPVSNYFASIGEDKRCRLWSLEDKDEDEDDQPEWKVSLTYCYTSVPHALVYRPNSSILAVAEKKVLIYDLSDHVVEPPLEFPLHDKGSQHMVGSVAWGCGSTADHVFASSEPKLRTFTGAHKVFDLLARKTIYQFDTKEAGDVIAIDPLGATLGLCTQAEENHHVLRLYDIARRNPKAYALVDLVPFPSRNGDNFEGEMNVASFSPDQLYLAIARNDNSIHVYDKRMLGIGPIFRYYHDGESKVVSNDEVYGVVQAQWLQSSSTMRTCLVTGGEDGCVRMWDPSTPIQDVDNGKILAEVNYDISQFSIGDPFGDEGRQHRLVVGDSSGEVSIFDHICV